MVFSLLVFVSAGAANSGVSAGDPDADIQLRWYIPTFAFVRLILTALGTSNICG